eukprot:Clim_evm57s156 gene=Clim_evmTU57s156
MAPAIPEQSVGVTSVPVVNVKNAKDAKTLIHQTKILINNEWVNSVSGKTFATLNPATEEVICQVQEGDAADIDKAVKAARAAFEKGAWPEMSGFDRSRLLHKLADLVEQHKEELAALDALDNGKPYHCARDQDITMVVDVFRYYAGWADKIEGDVIQQSSKNFCFTRREPVGVVGQIIPWNFPASMLSWKWGPALAMGCTIVLKPAEQTPLSALRIGELAIEAGFPPGVVNIVPGYGPTAGAALVNHPEVNKIAFTGSSEVGKLIASQCATTSLKRVTLELGGKSPAVVFADADMDEAIPQCHQGLFANMGQSCVASSRIFVEDKIYDEFVDRMVAQAKTWSMGDQWGDGTMHGPQVDKDQYEKILDLIESGKKSGARLALGGNAVAGKGYFIEPTVFCDVPDDSRIAKEEIFGPVISIFKFRGDDLDSVIERANNTDYGLGAGVFTRDIKKAHRLINSLRAGTVFVNCWNQVNVATPFGGYKSSGIGRELGKDALDNYTEKKTVIMTMDADIRR